MSGSCLLFEAGESDRCSAPLACGRHHAGKAWALGLIALRWLCDVVAGMVDVLNEVGIDYVCFGNHETDVPHVALLERIRESKFGASARTEQFLFSERDSKVGIWRREA